MHGRCSSAGRHMDNCQASAIHEAAADPMVDAQSLRPMTLNIIKPKATTNSALIPPDSIPKEVTVNFKGYLVSPPRWAIGPSWSPQATSADNIGCTVGGNFNVPSRHSPGIRL